MLCANKMKKWISIQSLVSLLEAEREKLEAERVELAVRINALNSSPSSFSDEVILKYIETRSTVKAAEFVKGKGIRSEKGTVYAAGDVSNLRGFK